MSVDVYSGASLFVADLNWVRVFEVSLLAFFTGLGIVGDLAG